MSLLLLTLIRVRLKYDRLSLALADAVAARALHRSVDTSVPTDLHILHTRCIRTSK